ncbi:MAG: IS200/IS605 family accessory protein TnpB-related protein [Sulfobacillus sp.]
MKTTIFGVLLDVTPEQETILHRLMRKYGWMLRFAFNRLLEGLPDIGALERHLARDTELPLRYAKDAVQEAQDLIRARHQAMQDGLKLWTQRVKKTRERLTALRAAQHPNLRRIAGQERKLAAQQAQQAFYQQHVDAHTFPPVVFGTKKRWLDRFKTLDDRIAEQARQQAWREDWDESRNGRLSARGDRTKRGNPLLRVRAGADHWILEISLDYLKPGKPDAQVPRYEKQAIPLYIARKVSKKTGQVNGRDYEGLLRRVLASGDPYQVEILRRHGRYQVRITVDEVPVPVQTDPRQGWVGVDTNSTFLALCHVLPNGNPHAFATFGDPRLFDIRSTHRDALVGRLAVETVQWAKDRGAGLVIEDLQFLHDRDVSAKFNRVTHQFNYRALLTAVERQAAREGVALRKVKPAYTSIIGRFKYQPQYGMSVHHAAALVIGRRGGLKVRRENVPKALRLWMQDRNQWNDPTYRKNDWSAWARIKRIMTKMLASHHQYLSAWLEYRKTLFSE